MADLTKALTMQSVVDRLTASGAVFETCASSEIATLRAELSPHLSDHPYFEFLEQFGTLTGLGQHNMLRPAEVLLQRAEQMSFYDDGSFGDSPEDERLLQREQQFRDCLIPFQYARSGGDFYCFVTKNTTETGPLIADIFHDDFDLVDDENGGGTMLNPALPTCYTRSLVEHLSWVADILDHEGDYPPSEPAAP